MNLALIRAISMMFLTGVIIFPYFNCGAPSNQSGLFGSDNTSCDPAKPDFCYGDPTLLSLAVANMPINGYPISTANGRFQINIPCYDGGFPKVTVGFKVISATKQFINDQAECISGNALIVGQLSTPDLQAWGAQSYQFVFQIYAYASKEAPFPISNWHQAYSGIQPVPRPAYKQ
ncbi:MAG: hypothetical protein A4S09_06880 [Proteobacteria bacterium SG_bin7]|nr:MAG: hypothetical protein A4S09_06880 [Proteobacteria bacterium SG_bin7]